MSACCAARGVTQLTKCVVHRTGTDAAHAAASSHRAVLRSVSAAGLLLHSHRADGRSAQSQRCLPRMCRSLDCSACISLLMLPLRFCQLAIKGAVTGWCMRPAWCWSCSMVPMMRCAWLCRRQSLHGPQEAAPHVWLAQDGAQDCLGHSPGSQLPA